MHLTVRYYMEIQEAISLEREEKWCCLLSSGLIKVTFIIEIVKTQHRDGCILVCYVRFLLQIHKERKRWKNLTDLLDPLKLKAFQLKRLNKTPQGICVKKQEKATAKAAKKQHQNTLNMWKWYDKRQIIFFTHWALTPQ